MKTVATVIELMGTKALVETERTSACEGCHKMAEGNGCSVCSLMGSGRKLRSVAENPVSAKVGDRVIVETETSRVLFYAALVFILPILLAVGGWFFAGIFSRELLWHSVGAAIGFVLTFVGLRIYSATLGRKRCDATVVSIVPAPVTALAAEKEDQSDPE